MDGILQCESCGHGAALHAGDGCEVFRCRCTHQRDAIVEDAVREAVETYRRQWQSDVAV